MYLFIRCEIIKCRHHVQKDRSLRVGQVQNFPGNSAHEVVTCGICRNWDILIIIDQLIEGHALAEEGIGLEIDVFVDKFVEFFLPDFDTIDIDEILDIFKGTSETTKSE